MELSRRSFLGSALAGAVAGSLPVTYASAEGDSEDALVHDLMAEESAWARFLAAADLVWKRMPQTWFEGPFLGNGRLGSMVYAEPGVNAVHFGVQHSEVQDHRPEFGSTYGLARLPIGHLTLEPVGGIGAIDWRLDLWNAELRGSITTAAGGLQLRAFIHDSRSVLVVEVTPSEGERDFRWVFHPEE